MTGFAPLPPPFVDDSRFLIAKEPRDYWRELRAGGVFLDLSGFYYVTRGEDVRAALRNHVVFASRRKQLAPSRAGVRSLPIPVPLAYDPPEHTRLRRILRPHFSPQAVSKLRPALCAQAAALVTAVAPVGACEAISAIAHPFPFGVLVTLCGLPWDDREKLAAWAEAVDWDTPGSPPAFKLLTYLVEAIGGVGRPSLASRLLTGDDPLTEDEVIGFYALLCFAQDGMQAAIGSALLLLARDPELRDRLRENPDQIRAFAEEVVRLETPLPFIGRFTTQEVTIAGVTIPAGSVVRLCLATANLNDGEGPHRSFGGGVHRCLGRALARAELSVIVAQWLRAVPRFHLEQGFVPSFTFTPGGAIMPSRLPLRWDSSGPKARGCDKPSSRPRCARASAERLLGR
ncbi:cytochrome P450 [Mycobacterium sp. UM_CSW]|uniref:cytochrome P450 n=1 Tax=Mycobacterium sp. UM_CSW TaxID=1370119 RepID=UPI00040F9930|nr:cytochrome P450 [Mycobacterium sp. UM_CSW]